MWVVDVAMMALDVPGHGGDPRTGIIHATRVYGEVRMVLRVLELCGRSGTKVDGTSSTLGAR